VRSRRRRRLVVGAAAGVALTASLGSFAVAASSSVWTWRVSGILSRTSACSRASEHAAADVCLYKVPNPPRASGTVTGVVRVTNTSSRATCYGVSLSTSYMAGLQSFCVKAKSTGQFTTSGPERHYHETQLSFFVTSGSKTRPISPLGDPYPSPFSVTFSERA
jgi:hypothetical protein